MEVTAYPSALFPTTFLCTQTNTGLSAFSGKLKTHAVKYSETAGTQSEAAVGRKNTDRMTSTKDKLHLDVAVSISLTVGEQFVCVCTHMSHESVCEMTVLQILRYWSPDKRRVHLPSFCDKAASFSCLIQKKGKHPERNSILFQVLHV